MLLIVSRRLLFQLTTIIYHIYIDLMLKAQFSDPVSGGFHGSTCRSFSQSSHDPGKRAAKSSRV